MSKFLTFFGTSLFSALIAVLIFSQLNNADTVYINSSPAQDNVHQASDHVLYNQSAFGATPPTNFVEAATEGRKSSVYIKAMKGDGSIASMGYGTGSGVVISSDGYIATNEHVVHEATEVEVTLDDNREYLARIVGTDSQTDLALLKIEAEGLSPAVFGNSDSLQVGEWVLAVGNPFRLQSTVTAGIVSAKARNINILAGRSGIESFIQTDAAVNPGNSGGSLINTRGEVIGINSAIMAQNGSYEGYSFAIPSNLAQKIIYDLRTYGSVQRGWLGITIKDIDQQTANRLGMEQVKGIYVVQVNKDEAADIAGLRTGDVIIKVNGVQLQSTPQFMELVGRYRPGDEIDLEFVRSGSYESTTAQLRNHVNSTDFITVRKEGVFRDLGVEVRDLTTAERKRLRDNGVYVISINRSRTIGKTNMDPGYVITHLNGQEVNQSEELMRLLEKSKGSITLDGFYENYPDQYSYKFSMK